MSERPCLGGAPARGGCLQGAKGDGATGGQIESGPPHPRTHTHQFIFIAAPMMVNLLSNTKGKQTENKPKLEPPNYNLIIGGVASKKAGGLLEGSKWGMGTSGWERKSLRFEGEL